MSKIELFPLVFDQAALQQPLPENPRVVEAFYLSEVTPRLRSRPDDTKLDRLRVEVSRLGARFHLAHELPRGLGLARNPVQPPSAAVAVSPFTAKAETREKTLRDLGGVLEKSGLFTPESIKAILDTATKGSRKGGLGLAHRSKMRWWHTNSGFAVAVRSESKVSHEYLRLRDAVAALN